MGEVKPPFDVAHAVGAHVTAAVETRDAPADAGGRYRVKHFSASVLLADCATSLAIGVAVAMPVSVIDYSIMAKVSGVSPSISIGLKDGFATLLMQPRKFFFKTAGNQRAFIFRVVATVYGLTYLSSNITCSVMDAQGYSQPQIDWARGIVSGIVNTGLTVWKDSVILRNLPPTGATAASTHVPGLSRAGFCCRDMITCIAAFTLVPIFARWLTEVYRGDASTIASNQTLAALTVPASLQLLTTPIHIASIRYQRTYPNPSFLDVSTALRADYVGAMLARVGRIVPAFGIGGICNASLLSSSTRAAEAGSSQ